jgi:hypothetical protein
MPFNTGRLLEYEYAATLSIYTHALEADELAAAKIWNDAMTR